jgi:predicted nucleotidyltransferase
MTEQVQQQWTTEAILQFLHQHRAKLRAMGVVKIGVFGSYARGEQHSNSDIDLLLIMENFTWRRWNDVWNYIEDRLGVPVDLVPEKDLRPELRQSVFSEVRYAQIS